MIPITFRSFKSGMCVVAYAKGIVGSVTGDHIRQVVLFKVIKRIHDHELNRIECKIAILDDLQAITHGNPKKGTDFHELKLGKCSKDELMTITINRKFNEHYEYFLMSDDEILSHLVATKI